MSSPREEGRPRDEGSSEERWDRLGAVARRILSHGPGPEERLDEFLAEIRHELDQHTARFEETLADIERREEVLRDSRLSIERLLRLGTRDLDARESDLTRLVMELTEREARLRDADAELTRRRSELGAVELQRAAVDQRERALAARETRLDEREAASAEDDETPSAGPSPLLLFMPGAAYRLVEIEHEPVSAGNVLDVEGETYMVSRTGPSPLPGDSRRCAYLVRGGPGSSPSGGSS
jgi:septal ring factor EnvC (AmiA/AmiB activator)